MTGLPSASAFRLAVIAASLAASAAVADSNQQDLVVLKSGETVQGFIMLDDAETGLLLLDSRCAGRRIARASVASIWRGQRPAGWKPPCRFDEQRARAVLRPGSAPAAKRRGRDYGWWLVPVDAAAAGAAAAALATSSRGLLIGAAAVQLLGGPLVHAFQGNPSTAFGSLAIRGGLPALGGFLALPTESEQAIGVAIGAGVLVSWIIDSVVLAKHGDAGPRREEPGVRWVPIYRGAALIGRF